MIPRILFAYLAAINLFGVYIIIADKRRAIRKKWRIPEKTFFIAALLGGSPGVYVSMLLVKHKTRHWYFMLGIPAIFAIQCALIYCYKKFI